MQAPQARSKLSDAESNLEASAEELVRHAFSRVSVRLVTQHLCDNAPVVTEPNSIPDMEA
jgi:hypothetical protein